MNNLGNLLLHFRKELVIMTAVVLHCVKSVQIRSFFLLPTFLYSDWIQENENQRKTPYLDTFHAV